MTNTNPIQIGILTVSDRAVAGVYEDRGGPAIVDYLTRVLANAWTPRRRMVRDETDEIAAAICDLSESGCDLVITTGGTGPAPRDVTPEATESVCDKMLPGFGECMRAVSLTHVPTAILSRQCAGIRGRTLIINLPGKPQAIAECLDAVFPAVPYCIDLIGGGRLETHPAEIKTFRPAGS
ncbi:MAG: molybdopterin adenylyltransferase [Planctomycetota bacterium]